MYMANLTGGNYSIATKKYYLGGKNVYDLVGPGGIRGLN